MGNNKNKKNPRNKKEQNTKSAQIGQSGTDVWRKTQFVYANGEFIENLLRIY